MKSLIVIIGVACSLLLMRHIYYVSRSSVPFHGSVTSDKFELKKEPDDGISWLVEQIDSSVKTIDVTMYQVNDPQVVGHLAQAKDRGVQVRVLLNDGYRGQGTPDNVAAYAYLERAGIGVKWTPGCYDLTHEKSVLIDNQILDVMTLNLNPKYYPSGREFAVVDTDTSDVRAAMKAFMGDWYGHCSNPPPSDHLVWSPGAKAATLKLIQSAQTSIDVYNEEMADTEVTEALETAAQHGVQVHVCMTYTSSWREPFNELTEAGVEVRTYASSADRYIHAKMILADNERVFVGSQNFSEPSLNNNRELGLIMTDRGVVNQLDETFAADFTEARPYIER